ncbi:DUF695 domain-containing protein [Nonomuraea sp. NPDC046570]|uniref:DUF695 domain-containing protein n=1 Tax=Nonomuraea sp. NPDC046570 TaxID=3155255 RepID=UPI0033D9F57A
MRLFGRKDGAAPEPNEGVAAFWSWWQETRPQIDAMLDAAEAEAEANLQAEAERPAERPVERPSERPAEPPAERIDSGDGISATELAEFERLIQGFDAPEAERPAGTEPTEGPNQATAEDAGTAEEAGAAEEAGSSGAERLAAYLGPAVAAIHPDLVGEIVPGRNAAHALVVTAAGDPELRSLAHRWARAAPPADAQWEYHPSRQANPRALALRLEVGGYEFALAELRLGLRVPRGTPRVDVSAFHPVFVMLDEETRLEATLLALDWLLGEDDVARWVGEITPTTFQPIDAVEAVHFPAVVADLASEYTEEQWAQLEGQTADGSRLVAVTRFPLRPVDHPLFDQHIAIALPYARADDEGLPEGRSLAALRDFEERLSRQLLKLRGGAVLAAHVSAERHRVLHIYADPASEAAAKLKELATSWKEGHPRVDVALDPAWTAVAPFLS